MINKVIIILLLSIVKIEAASVITNAENTEVQNLYLGIFINL